MPLTIIVPDDRGPLQDLDETDDGVYLFFGNSSVVCYNPVTGQKNYEATALDAGDARLYASSSLVVKDYNGCFYQLRDGDAFHLSFA